MNVVTPEDLRELVLPQTGPCVSIFQPAHRAGPDTRTHAQEDPVRFKNLLREARQRLAAGGVQGREADALLVPARRLLDDRADVLQHVPDGAAQRRARLPRHRDHHRLGAQPHRAGHRHRRVHAEGARLVGRGDKTRPLRAIGDADRTPAQRRIVLLFNGRKKGVHIDENDRARPG